MNKINALRELLERYDIDGYFVPSADEYQNEYVPEDKRRLKHLTGFSGSNGLALITKNDKILFTDGRYLLQARTELESDWQVEQYSDDSLRKYTGKLRIGFDPKLHTIAQIERLGGLDLVDVNVWNEVLGSSPRMTITAHNIFIHDIKYSGQHTVIKQKKLTSYIIQEKLDAVIITACDSICWLLNLRGNDVEYNPIILGYLIAYSDGRMSWFLEQIPAPDMVKYLAKHKVQSRLASELGDELEQLKNRRTQASPNSSWWFKIKLPQIILKADPCELPKACKNQTEINGAIEAHLKDGAALVEFLCWLDANVTIQRNKEDGLPRRFAPRNDEAQENDRLSEISTSQKLLEFRQQQINFVYPSFATIMGFAQNGAVIHYHPTPQTNKSIEGDNLLLIDSGGQYFEGTTDVTRTIAIGKPNAAQIHDFTLVLKAHIALATAVFSIDTSGDQLDQIARKLLLDAGRDYAHGTGHGVGSFLSVHEGPQRISKNANNARFQPGMIVSIEPGYYLEGAYGIRIENLAYIVEAEEKGFLKFIILTKAPIDLSLVDFSLLTKNELAWLQDYHLDVMRSLKARLSDKAKEWLCRYCANDN